MIYIRSKWITPHHWTWTVSDNSSSNNNNNINRYNLMQKKLEKFLSKYPLIDPHRAHEGFTCDAWNCKTTFNINKNEWIEPRKEYKSKLPDNKIYYEWMERHKQQNKQLINSQQQCEWIFIGDSITFSWNYHQNVFNKYFNTNNNAIIYAQSGDKIHEIGWRLNNKQENGFKNMQQCLNNNIGQTNIVLLIGTNDIGSGTKYDIILQDFMILLDQLTQFIVNNNNKNNNVKLYLLAIFPRGETYISFNDRMEMKDQLKQTENFNVDNAYFYSINFINDYLKYFAQNYDKDYIEYLDCNEYFMKDINIIEFKDNDDDLHEYKTGTMTLDTMDDMLHLNEKGYEQLAQCILHNTMYG